MQATAHDTDLPAHRFGARLELGGGDLVLLQPLEDPLSGARTGDDDHRAATGR